MVLIGTVSLQYENTVKVAFAVGASSVSVVFFSILGYGARVLSGFMKRRRAWQALDALVTLGMLILAGDMARVRGWV